jgi:hypothetical protein
MPGADPVTSSASRLRVTVPGRSIVLVASAAAIAEESHAATATIGPSQPAQSDSPASSSPASGAGAFDASNVRAWRLALAQDISARHGLAACSCVQARYGEGKIASTPAADCSWRRRS